MKEINNISEFNYYKRVVNKEVVELCVENENRMDYIGNYNNEECCEFLPISKEEFIKIGTTLNMFVAPTLPIPLFIQD